MEPKQIESLAPKKIKHKTKKLKKTPVEEDMPTIAMNSEQSKKPLVTKSSSSNVPSNKKRKKRDSASSDEERWLTAIESGKLEDVDDELKKIKPKDPALMTARQRAMYERGSDGADTLMSLPTGYKEKVMTAEAIQKAQIKSQKRKQLADEKREKDKKKTMERLLKKQESKATKDAKPRKAKSLDPAVIYQQNAFLTTISFPESIECPIKAVQYKKPRTPTYCITGCGNIKKYSCSKTGAPLCSLMCYKENIANRIL
ncbi:INO80 complex subunit B-like [Agrilus planipennis]|uniref:INO80 complex subunit B-like n=1 Tax=Agrilus planipennis TaxID=224129 RepID=A0A7F5RI13_AGRPL|nr:INO80 complex subunit B-like [Agrilus planipennis]